MATIEFTATPDTISLGESATLRWDVEGVRAVHLNGQGVVGHDSRVVTPAVTTTYTLRITMLNDTVEERAVTVNVEGAVVAPGDATRPPTVVLTPENIERLKQYPRPPQDNGRGLHFHIDLSDETIAKSVERLQYINATWTLIYAQDELQAGRAAKACWAAGIMPVVRIGKQIDVGFDPVPYVRALQEIGAPPYIQIFNEPGDHREWRDDRPENYIHIFARNWAYQAARVFDAGGFPGLQVMGKSELDGAIQAVAQTGRTDIWQRAFKGV